MLSTLIHVAIYGVIIIGLLDIVLYISVKIKDKIRKRKNVVPVASPDHEVKDVMSGAATGTSDNIERTKKGA